MNSRPKPAKTKDVKARRLDGMGEGEKKEKRREEKRGREGATLLLRGVWVPGTRQTKGGCTKAA